MRSAPDATTANDVGRIRQAMHATLLAISADPAFLTVCPTPPSISLEKPTSHGGKFWKGTALPQHLSLRWGRIGFHGHGRRVPAAKCSGNNPVEELMTRALLKIHDGYALVLIT